MNLQLLLLTGQLLEALNGKSKCCRYRPFFTTSEVSLEQGNAKKTNGVWLFCCWELLNAQL